ncbi:MAG TPA: amidohydrolase family protein [Candidatus Limnocylindrales bacterium]|nr:amidohydrolase family protein [Candidatus Limnocylindrales bacterium]
MAELASVIRATDAILPHGRQRVDIGIGADGTIGALAAAGTLEGREVVDGDGLVAIPGGIDLHVHLNTFFGGTTTRDDFASGTAAALLGGTTTIAQFAIPRPGETTIDAIERTRGEAGGAAVADYVVHGSAVKETFERSLDQLERLPDLGIRTVKIFTAYTDAIGLTIGEVHRLLAVAARAGIVVFVHAETDSLVREGIDAAVHDVGTGPVGHARSRTPLAETDAIRTVADLALDTGATAYFVHVSSSSSVATLADRRSRGEHLLAETCPHYLFLDEAVYERDFAERWICSPPIRSADHRAALWEGLRDGVIDAVSSDHNCFDTAQKAAGGGDFRAVPNGLPGIEHRLPLLVGAAIDGRLPWSRVVDVTSAGAARILGLWPRKGSISVGADADIVLVDPAGSTPLGPGHMATDWSPYDGLEAPGRIVRVLRRGETVAVDGTLGAAPGSGRWLPLGPGLGDRVVAA